MITCSISTPIPESSTPNSEFSTRNSEFSTPKSEICCSTQAKGCMGDLPAEKGPQKSWRLKGQASSKSLLKYPFGPGPYRPRKNSHVHGHLGATQISSTWPPDLGAPRLIHAAPRSGGIWKPTYTRHINMAHARVSRGHARARVAT